MVKEDLVLRGATVVGESEIAPGDVVVRGGKVAAILAAGAAPRGGREISCDGLTALPGLIDTHAHHREPGFTYKEDIVSATAQCAAGGITVSVGMPNVDPPPTSGQILDEMLALYGAKAIVDYNVNPTPTDTAQIQEMASRGILAFKLFMVEDTGRSYPHMPGIGTTDHGDIFRIMRAVEGTGLPLMVHPHDQSLMSAIEQEYWSRGERDYAAYARAYAEHDGVIWDTAVGLLLRLQQSTSVQLHLLHTQTEGALHLIASARQAGRAVTCEVNPWCLWLGNDWPTIERLGPYALSYYVPPRHASAVWAAFRDGAVDVLASDHGPHTREDKEPGWVDGWKAHTGTPSAQFYLSLLLTEVNAGRITLRRAVEVASTKPAQIFGLYPSKGAIRTGADADIVLVDLAARRTIADTDVLSKCGWTPYRDKTVQGVPVYTLLRGQPIFENGEVVGEPGRAQQAVPVSAANGRVRHG
jgi:dihydroorotase